MGEWQHISEKFELERVIVCGFQCSRKGVEGYWWYYEDVIVDGVSENHPTATHCIRIKDLLPEFPAHPTN